MDLLTSIIISVMEVMVVDIIVIVTIVLLIYFIQAIKTLALVVIKKELEINKINIFTIVKLVILAGINGFVFYGVDIFIVTRLIDNNIITMIMLLLDAITNFTVGMSTISIFIKEKNYGERT
jgi:hypothetical protein